MSRLPTTSTLFPYTTLFRSCHGPFNSDDGRLLFDRLRTKIALKQAGLCTKGQSRDSHTFRRRRVFDIACNKRNAERPVLPSPAVGFWVLVGQEALRQDGMDVPNISTGQGRLGALSELRNPPLVDRAKV